MDTDTTSPLPFELSGVVRTCEEVWASIRDRHPEVPEVVILVGSGEERGKLRKLGHWSAGRWAVPDGEGMGRRGEVLIAAEGFKHGAADVLDTLLHEAAHAIAHVRKVKDTTRGGRYHNERYKHIAEEVGLAVEKMGPHGWAKTALGEGTADRYAGELVMLQLSLTAWRRQRRERPDGSEPGSSEAEGGQGASAADAGGRKRGQLPLFVCGCPKPRKMRMAAATAALGDVTCGVCGQPFREEGATAANPE